MMERADVLRLLAEHKRLLTQPNVVSIDVAEKTTGGEPTGTQALVVGVIHKRPAADLAPPDEPVPAEVHVDTPAGPVTLPTDVVETGEITAVNGAVPGGTLIRTQGLQIGGSLGVNITYNGTYRLLSCAHVLTAYDQKFVGATVDACDDDWEDCKPLVPVTGQVPVTYYPSSNVPDPVLNTQDLAWADITPQVGSPSITQIGVPSGTRAPKVGEQVQVYGGYTQSLEDSTVKSDTAHVTVKGLASDGSTIYSFWGPVVELDGTTLALLAGDSGSAVVATADTAVVGLAFAVSMLSVHACVL